MSTSEEELAVVLDHAPFETEDEFVRWWLDTLCYHAEGEEDRKVVLSTIKMQPVKCDCREVYCRGWKMKPRPAISPA